MSPSTTFFLLLLSLAVVVPETTTALSTPAPPKTILDACHAARYPDLCLSSLSHLPPTSTATEITTALLSSSTTLLENSIITIHSILSTSTSNLNLTNAANNCLEFLSFSHIRLAYAIASLSSYSLHDARAFAGAAELYQYDCWSALKYVNDTQQIANAMSALATLANLTGDATAMIAALQRYGPNTSLWTVPQTERDGYWPEPCPSSWPHSTGLSDFPIQSPDVTVCKGGECDYSTVQEAVDDAPELCSEKYVIYIKSGVYEEIVRVGFNKTNLVFVGDGMGKTVITGSLNAGTVGVSTYNTATVAVNGDGFMAYNLTFANTAGPEQHQAVALRSDSDFSIFELVEFVGHQDTLYAHSLRQFYKYCRISGTVDFIFGNSAAVFENCSIFVLPRQVNPKRGESNTVTAHGRTDPAQPTGFVFHQCSINGSQDYVALYRAKPAVHRVYLGRPWKEYSRTVFIECYLSEIVRPEGWLPWSGDFALKTLFYGEFGSLGPGANVTGRVPWSNQISAERLRVYSVSNFLGGTLWIPSRLQDRLW